MAAAEASLRAGELELAESRYRSALGEGWLLLGLVEASENRLPEARESFRRATVSVADARRALQLLALAHLELGETKEAISILAPLATRSPQDGALRRLFAQALALDQRPEEAVQELEGALQAAPGDLELVFALASLHLKLGRMTAAEAPVLTTPRRAAPSPRPTSSWGAPTATSGTTSERAACSARRFRSTRKFATRPLPPGTASRCGRKGVSALEAAIVEFEQERVLAPDDLAANLYLGLALLEARRPEAALPALEAAARATPPLSSALPVPGPLPARAPASAGGDRGAAAVARARRSAGSRARDPAEHPLPARAGPADPGPGRRGGPALPGRRSLLGHDREQRPRPPGPIPA